MRPYSLLAAMIFAAVLTGCSAGVQTSEDPRSECERGGGAWRAALERCEIFAPPN